ncbi:MAG: hypothetical protein PHG61_10665, partial [Candidatus Marinimicrobia bacterium]|nr:hypothetical protein [Candidatus Neomarinimicrobiota bacterium]
GNVGIGTTSPTKKLIVNSADQIISWFRSNNSGFSRIFIDHFGSGDAQATFAVDGNSRWSIGNDATDSSFKIMPSGNKAFDSTASMTILSSGNVGIGTTNPGYKLDTFTSTGTDAYIRNQRDDTVNQDLGYIFANEGSDLWYNYVIANGDDLYWTKGSNDLMTLTDSGYLGIGPNYTSPTGLLDVNNKFIVTDEQITMNVPLNLATAGDISIASDLQFTNPTASAIKSYAPLLIEAGDPSQNVDLTLRGSNTGEVVVDDILRVTSNAYLSSATLSGNVDMQYNDLNNVDKLTVNTIDPVHKIDGKEYATYASFYAGGQKMETSGIVNLQAIYEATYEARPRSTTYEARPRSPRSTSLEKGEPSILKGSTSYMYKIDFNNLEVGSDLWLFWQTIHQDLSKVVVLLTPSFNGRVWYEKTSSQVRPVKKLGAQSSIIIYSDQPGEVSYRLTAPREDYDQWPNLISGI